MQESVWDAAEGAFEESRVVMRIEKKLEANEMVEEQEEVHLNVGKHVYEKGLMEV